MSARTLMFLALALRGIDVLLGPWRSAPQLLSLFWCLVLAGAVIALRSKPRLGTIVALRLALLSVVNAVGILRAPVEEFEILVPFFHLRRVLWIGEAIVIVAAATVAVATQLRVSRSIGVRTPLRERRLLLIGSGSWSIALALILWWPGNPWASYLLSPLIPMTLVLRFLLAHRLGRADAILARVAGWIGVLCCLLTLMPIAYGLIIVYLLLTVRGTVIFALAVGGTIGLLSGARDVSSATRR